MIILLETFIIFILSLVIYMTSKNILYYITYGLLLVALIPFIKILLKRGLKSLSVGYTYTSTNIILVVLNLILYIFLFLFNINVILFVIIGLNGLKLAIDIVKLITGREIII